MLLKEENGNHMKVNRILAGSAALVVGALALAGCSTAGASQSSDGKVSMTDGPFAETKEQLAGFYMIDAKDLDEAISLAAKIPPATVGSIEVRPVR